MKYFHELIVKLAIIVYDFALVAGTAYLVEIHNWSMWSFCLTLLFFMVTKKENETKSKDTTGSNQT